ncbi:MAG TPA: type IV pilin protein [Polyangiaceae bacterium]|jgi:Tfp pilus assembly protein PilE
MNRTLLLLAVLALTSCNGVARYKCLSRQAEAKSTLATVQSAETTYYASHKSYTASTSDLGIPVTPRFYSLELSITGGGTGYKATAKGDKTETMGDEWSVDQTGTVVAVHDKCHE